MHFANKLLHKTEPVKFLPASSLYLHCYHSQLPLNAKALDYHFHLQSVFDHVFHPYFVVYQMRFLQLHLFQHCNQQIRRLENNSIPNKLDSKSHSQSINCQTPLQNLVSNKIDTEELHFQETTSKKNTPTRQ